MTATPRNGWPASWDFEPAAYAGDFVKAMWLVVQHPTPDDFVIATGRAILCARCTSRLLVSSSSTTGSSSGPTRGIRPAEADHLRGDATKARKALG